MSLPRLIEIKPRIDYRFEDENDNVVLVHESSRVLDAILRKGNNLTLGFPITYKYYNLFVQQPANLTSDDFKYMTQYKNMTTFSLIDDTNTTLEFLKYLNQMESLGKLKYLTMNLHPHTYKRFQVKPIFKHLPGFQHMSLGSHSLSREQIDEFIRDQEIPEYIETVITSDYIDFNVKDSFSFI